MKSILFSHAYFLRFNPKQWDVRIPYAPLGTLYAAALMQNNGYRVALFNVMFAKDAREVPGPIDSAIPDFFVVCDDGFNYLTKMCLTNMREAAFKMIKPHQIAFHKQLHRYVHGDFLRIKSNAYLKDIFKQPHRFHFADWRNILKLAYYIFQETILKLKMEATKS